jgi:hypothetical protein
MFHKDRYRHSKVDREGMYRQREHGDLIGLFLFFQSKEVGWLHSFIHSFIHSYFCYTHWSIGHPWNVSFHFSFLIINQSVGLLGRGISPSHGRYLHRTT